MIYKSEESGNISLDIGPAIIKILKDDEQIGQIDYELDFDSNVACLMDWVIKKEERHQGYGRKAITLFHDYLRTLEMRWVIGECGSEEDQDLLIEFYKSLGYIIGDDMEMGKRL